MSLKKIIEKSNILTLPKISFSIFLMLLMLDSIIRAESVISVLKNDWIDIVATLFIIAYMISSAFEKTTFPKKKPLTTFMLLLFSFYIVYIDIRLLFLMINGEKPHDILIEVWVTSSFGLFILIMSLLIDSIISKKSNK